MWYIGADEDSINHFIFECPHVIQTLALSKIPSNPKVFSTPSIFTNIYYLFWRLPKEVNFNYFP